MNEDKVRVLRVVQYEGPRSVVERQVAASLHGTKLLPNGLRITAVTLTEFPEVLERERVGELGHAFSNDYDFRPRPTGSKGSAE